MSEYPQQPGWQQPPMPPAPKKPRTFLKVMLGVLVAGVLLIGGCVAMVAVGLDEASKDAEKASVPTVEPTVPAVDDAPTEPPDTEPPAVPEPEPTPEPDDEIAKVGATQWFTYEDGLKVQVTKLTKFTISDVAAGGKAGGGGVIVTVTIKNTGKTRFDASLASVNLLAGANGDEAESVYDSKYETGFDGSIAAGKSGTAKWGFAVTKAQLKQLVVEVTPAFEYSGATFEGSLK